MIDIENTFYFFKRNRLEDLLEWMKSKAEGQFVYFNYIADFDEDMRFDIWQGNEGVVILDCVIYAMDLMFGKLAKPDFVRDNVGQLVASVEDSAIPLLDYDIASYLQINPGLNYL